jgi:uncharacterized protein YuzE
VGQGPTMKFDYYPETDSSYLQLVDEVAAETHQIFDGVNADVALIGIEIERVTPPHIQTDAARQVRIVATAATAVSASIDDAQAAG